MGFFKHFTISKMSKMTDEPTVLGDFMKPKCVFMIPNFGFKKPPPVQFGYV